MTGAKRKKGAGPPMLYGEVMKSRTVRMTDAQYDAYNMLGAGKWLRKLITDAALKLKK